MATPPQIKPGGDITIAHETTEATAITKALENKRSLLSQLRYRKDEAELHVVHKLRRLELYQARATSQFNAWLTRSQARARRVFRHNSPAEIADMIRVNSQCSQYFIDARLDEQEALREYEEACKELQDVQDKLKELEGSDGDVE
ncbi:uncharacterized protein J3D65DRAFT_670559 [Phyllosticta citribraziliensis]|uniref:Uncharacterized protein n=1 Tax=Phyllosticta citribraziliensis TaxID=989973 RepID=A0ABR1LDQ1_9PEZI